ncbi:MAG: hypothetical protein Kow0092_37400 [Deferrisomatales bacterium]
MDRVCAHAVGDHAQGQPLAAFNWDMALALLTYAAASAADYLLTLTGLLTREIRELNPLLNVYIDHLGPAWGLLVPKLLLGFTVVLASSLYIHDRHRRRLTRVRAEYVLYGGALFTALAPLHWVVLKHWG